MWLGGVLGQVAALSQGGQLGWSRWGRVNESRISGAELPDPRGMAGEGGALLAGAEPLGCLVSHN